MARDSRADRRPSEVMLVAGEASGDARGAELVRNLRQRDPSVQFFGMGGADLRQAGMRVIYGRRESRERGFLGAVREPPPHLAGLPGAAAATGRRPSVVADPDRFSGIQHAPGAHRAAPRHFRPLLHQPADLGMASLPGQADRRERGCHGRGLPLRGRTSTRPWAWAPVSFVGHPLVDVVKPDRDRRTSLRAAGLDDGKLTVAIMPGSRRRRRSPRSWAPCSRPPGS